LGRPAAALNAYERAIACAPPSKNSFLGAALVQIRLGRLDQAAETLARFDRLAPDPDPEALAIRSVLARKQGDFAKADTLEQSARRLDPATASWALQRALQTR
ncbi:MAG: tetratricopeptide repeat protein, partial [Limisphaerales bacterium]